MEKSTSNRPPSRHDYFDLLSPYFLDDELESIGAAYKFSKAGHALQTREDGSRYFDHPKSVSLIIFKEWAIYDRQTIISALLHDLREDSFILSEYRIKLNFGRQVAWIVKLLTKEAGTKHVYYDRLIASNNWRAMMVKLADRIHNTRTMSVRPLDKQKDQVREVQKHFYSLAHKTLEVMPRIHRHAIPLIIKEFDDLCTRYDIKT